MKGRLQSKAGFTLVEAMIAMVIMLLISGAVSTLYFSSFRVWQRCSSQSQADPPAFMAINRITKELKNAYTVDSWGTNSITFTLPETEAMYIDGQWLKVDIVPLTGDKQITYYLSDATGSQTKSGTYLWRKQVTLASSQTNYMKIAENVEELVFDPVVIADRVLKIYTMSVVVQGQEGQQKYRSSFGSNVAFRNLPLN